MEGLLLLQQGWVFAMAKTIFYGKNYFCHGKNYFCRNTGKNW